MFSSLKKCVRGRSAAAAVAAAAGTVILAFGVVDVGLAANAPGTLYVPVDLTCTFTVPTLGTKSANVPMPTRFAFPTAAKVGEPAEASIAITYTVLSNGMPIGDQLAKYGVASIKFDAKLNGSWAGAATGPAQTQLADTLTPPATGDWPLVLKFPLKTTPTAAGEATLMGAQTKIVDFLATPLQADGQPSGLGTIPATCDLATGQDPALFSFPVTA